MKRRFRPERNPSWLGILTGLMVVMVFIGSPVRADTGTDIILCNSTPLPVSSSIAYRGDTEWRAKGWFVIEPGDCVVPDILTRNTVFYALATSADVEWGGPHTFCVDPGQAFHYRNRPNCADSAGFVEHNVSDNVAYTINYECENCDFISTPRYYKNGPPLKVYGRWCGPGYPKGFDPGPPVDIIDTACFDHDQRYVQCARIPGKEQRLECELEADSTLMREFRGITSSGEHNLNPAKLAYVSTMIRYLSYQAQIKYKTGEAKQVMNQGRESLTVVMGKAKESVISTSAELTENLRKAWDRVKRGTSKDNANFGKVESQGQQTNTGE